MKLDDGLLKNYMLSILITMFGFLVGNYFSSFATQADFGVMRTQVTNQAEDIKEIKQDVKLIRDILLGKDLPNPNGH